MGNTLLERNSMERWLTLVALGKEHTVTELQRNADGTYPVTFSIGGVELDFSLVAERIESSLDELVSSKAQKLLDERYESLLKEIRNIQERIELQKEYFQYDWEKEETNN